MACHAQDHNVYSMEGYEPPQCLWTLVKQHVPESELPEIRAVLGEALVDLYTEMYSEMETWLQIWREAHSRQNFRPRTPRPTLADPPAIKELLRDEIRLLLLTMQDVATREGRDGDTFTFKFSPSVVSYAMAGWQPEATGRSLEVRSSSRLSSSSTGEEDIKAMKDKLNVSTIDDVVAHLKSVFEEECEMLKRDVQFLQDCVEKYFLDHSDELVPEPTISELRAERRHIERELQLQSQSPCCRCPDRSSVDGGLMEGLRATQQMVLSAPELVPQIWLPSPTPSNVGQPLTHSPLLPVKHNAEYLPPNVPVYQTSHSSVLGSSCHASGHHGDDSVQNNCSNLHSKRDSRAQTLVKDRTPRTNVSTSGPSSATVEVRPHVTCDVHLHRATATPPFKVHFGTLSASSCGMAQRGPPGHCCAQPLPSVSRGTRTTWLATRPFLPSPPKTQRPANRGQSVTRRLRLLEANSLVSPS
ncbi:coiled-coil domain-containing protein 24 [Arapaima gigas]